MTSFFDTALSHADCTWDAFERQYVELAAKSVDPESMPVFLYEWSRLRARVVETGNLLRIAAARDTADQRALASYAAFTAEVCPQVEAAEQALWRKVLESNPEPIESNVLFGTARLQADLVCESTVPLLAAERRAQLTYESALNVRTVHWRGQEMPPCGLAPVYASEERRERERAWRLEMGRQLEDRDRIADVWHQLMRTRRQLSSEMGLESYRSYCWRRLGRQNYTPEDCLRFHDAVEEFATAAVVRVHERRRRRLGVRTLRPWDLEVDLEPLPEFMSVQEMEDVAARLLTSVDERFGVQFQGLREAGTLDLACRRDKAAGASCIPLPSTGRAFVLQNAIGTIQDLDTLMRCAGYAICALESGPSPMILPGEAGGGFARLVGMVLPLLAQASLSIENGGPFSFEVARRMCALQLERCLLRWPVVAMSDAFQHWAYDHPDIALDTARCGEEWTRLWLRFLPSVDWTGLEDIVAADWQQRPEIFCHPFRGVEEGIAQVGAVELWAAAGNDRETIVAQIKEALSLRGASRMPELFHAAATRFDFGDHALREAVLCVEDALEDLETA